MPPETSQTLDRGIRVVELLAMPEHSAGLTISELAGLLATGRPVVYRLVATLESHDLVTRRDGRVRLGLGLHRLAAAVVPSIREAALPALRVLADAAGATAHLTVAEGDEAVALVVVEPRWTDYHVAYREGARHPLDVGAGGRALLAGRAGRAGREPQVVASSGELQAGAFGLAVALPRSGGSGGSEPGVEASVGVVALHELSAEAIGPLVCRAAADLARALS
ncbi:IclR family transcriptional regulator [Knoellia sinensis KCTC 19936]|uniref:IclR family transcriptional regulator n=1 Tax=Knoellia sinensis KCTC 19936 TaxID=1385520 RepID=A0A0A0J224_9MICO|nr:helix-turn-helix domain-containing protein [Knoellia sinensis]KGN30754.1 IclR family transcriptional regulator [Knoellia sinensis KCTC 19936]